MTFQQSGLNLFHQNSSIQLIHVFSNDLIGICCPTLRITATGPAKTAKSSKLGNYEFHKLGSDGRDIFKQTPKISQRNYIYFSKTDKWTVSHIISHEAIIGGINHHFLQIIVNYITTFFFFR